MNVQLVKRDIVTHKHVRRNVHASQLNANGSKPLSGLLVCRLIMSLAERLSSKFHICPQSFVSRPNVHFSDNLSAADIIS